MADKRCFLRALFLALALGFMLVAPGTARAGGSAVGEVAGGVGEILGGVLALPMNVLAGTFTGPPIVGTVGGMFTGTFQTLGMTAHGLFRIARGGIPLAMKLLPFLPFAL